MPLSDLHKVAHFEAAELWLGTQTSNSWSVCFWLYWDAWRLCLSLSDCVSQTPWLESLRAYGDTEVSTCEVSLLFRRDTENSQCLLKWWLINLNLASGYQEASDIVVFQQVLLPLLLASVTPSLFWSRKGDCGTVTWCTWAPGLLSLWPTAGLCVGPSSNTLLTHECRLLCLVRYSSYPWVLKIT